MKKCTKRWVWYWTQRCTWVCAWLTLEVTQAQNDSTKVASEGLHKISLQVKRKMVMFVVDGLLHSAIEGTLEGAPKDAPRSYHEFWK